MQFIHLQKKAIELYGKNYIDLLPRQKNHVKALLRNGPLFEMDKKEKNETGGKQNATKR